MYRIERTVSYSDLGEDGVLSLGAAVDFLQDCSMFQLGSLHPLTEYFEEHGLGMYLVSRQMDLIRMPSYGEAISVVTWVYECKSMYGFRNTILYGEDGKPCIASYATGAFVNLQTGRPLRMPEDITGSVAMYDRHPMEYLPRKISLPRQGGEGCESLLVRRYHLDNNHHVNNSKYISIAQEFLPEGFSFDRVRVEYKTPARYGAVMYPVRYLSGHTAILSLNGENDTVYAVVEFSKK